MVMVGNDIATRPWWTPTQKRRTEDEWRSLLEEMTTVQRLVHLGGRLVEDDVRAWADRIFDDARYAYRDALQDEINKWGCAGTQAVVPDVGPELSAIRARADWAADSIINTYNYELALEIMAIGQQTPSANRHVYAYRLYYGPGGWDGLYWQDKAEQVAQVETMTVINAAVADFYFRNDIDPEVVLIEPQIAQCDICKEIVDGNPYDSVEDVFRRYSLPAHVGCPHHAATYPSSRLTPQQCLDLWVGI